MGKDLSGSVKKFTVEGVPFRVSADTNVSRKPTNVENDMIPSSGKGMRKVTRVTPKAEGFNLLVNAEEVEELKSFAESLDNVKVSYETAAGDLYRCVGQIEMEAHETEENKVTVTVLPEEDWTAFTA